MAHRYVLALFFVALVGVSCRADRIYVINTAGYNTMEANLLAAIQANGHTVVTSATTTLPNGFTSTCNDPNGYDWLCFFGNTNYVAMLPQIEQFLNAGGKVFYQYEVSCCTISSGSVASILSTLTGMSITPNVNDYIGFSGAGNVPGWEAANVSCCVTIKGNAYKGLDGLPVPNQLQATATLNGGSPPVSTCTNFGFFFSASDFNFAGTTHRGAILGMGDINAWYDSGEPGSLAVNQGVVNFFFPNQNSTCYLLPPGCIENYISPTLHVDLGNDTTLCQGTTLTLNAGNVSGTYLWQDNSTASSFNVSQAGTYWVKVVSHCDSVSDTIHVNVTPSASFNFGPDTTYCGAFTRVLSSGDPSTVWSTGVTAAQITVTTAGTYWAAGSGCNGPAHDTITISTSVAPPVSLGPDTFVCQGQAINYALNVPGATYAWSNGSTANTVTINSAGQIWVRVSNAGCTSTDTVNLLVQSPPVLFNLGADTNYCSAFTRVLSAADPHTVWSTGATAAQITVSTPTTYWATLNSSCGTATDTIVLTQGSVAPFNLGADTTICQGQPVHYALSLTGAGYLWSNGSTTSAITTGNPGNVWVQVTQNGCVAADTVNIAVVNSVPNPFNLGNDTAYCGAFTRILDAGDASAVWNTGVTNAQIAVTTPATYWAVITNLCGATSDTIVISPDSLNTFTLGADTVICQGQPAIYAVPLQNVAYLWSTGATTASITVADSGLVWVQAVRGACLETDTVVVAVDAPAIPFTLGADTAFCGNFTINLNAANSNAVWNTGITAQQITVTNPGLYWAVVNSACGKASDTVTLTDHPVPNPVISTNAATICPNATTQICAGSGFVQYQWNAGLNDSLPCIEVSTEGNYYVTVYDANNCSAESNHLQISTYPTPAISISVTGDTLVVHDVSVCQWYLNGVPIPGATLPLLVATQDGSYTVSITDSAGCSTKSNPIVVTMEVTSTGNINGKVPGIYPNPTNSGWRLTTTRDYIGALIEVIDDNGRLVYSAPITETDTNINPEVASGVYFMRISNSRIQKVYKLIKM